ncbi:MAG: UDP-N-acetylmuramate dehydrogenase [Desulfovermiculus sp.]
MNIVSRPRLKDRTRLKIGGRAQAEVRIEKPGDWDFLPDFLQREGLSPLVLGRGSNLLVQDGDLPLCLVVPKNIHRPEPRSADQDRVVIRVPAGFPLPGLLRWLQRQGLSGLEGLTGIPAHVGGAVAMNAGSFGQCMGDCLYRVRCWSPRTGLIWLERKDVHCAYRTFRPHELQGEWMIQEVELIFSRGKASEVNSRMQRCLERKRQTQPVGERTCGCTFKNPEQAPAGLLLDHSGMRGKQIGEVGFSDQHANFLINRGNGTFTQAWELIHEAQNKVMTRYGVDLELEVQLIGPQGNWT